MCHTVRECLVRHLMSELCDDWGPAFALTSRHQTERLRFLLQAREAWRGVSWGPGYEAQWSAMRVLCALDVVERIVVEDAELCTPDQVAWVLDELPANKIVLHYNTVNACPLLRSNHR